MWADHLSDDVQQSRMVKHDKFYFDDGDVVWYSLEDSQGITTVFRVHRVLLMIRSSVFSERFSPGYDDEQETHGDVPIIRMEDEAEDLAQLLQLVYDPEYVHHVTPARHPWS